MIVGGRCRSTSATSRTSCPTCCGSGSTSRRSSTTRTRCREKYRWLLDVNPLGQLLTALERRAQPRAAADRDRAAAVGAAPGRSGSSSSAACSSSPGSVSSLSVSERTAISVEDVSVTYRTTLERAPTLRSTVAQLGRAREDRARDRGGQARLVRRPARHGARHRRRQRRRQVDARAHDRRHPAAERGPRRDPRARQHAARARRRLQQEAVGARQRAARRARGGAQARAAGGEVRRHRRASPSSRTSWTCRCGPTRPACTGGSRSPSP